MIPAASPRPPIKPTCRCPALVRSYFPDCTEDSIGDFLLAATPYPCGDCDDVEQALCEPTDRDVFLRWATEAEIAAAPELAGLHRR